MGALCQAWAEHLVRGLRAMASIDLDGPDLRLGLYGETATRCSLPRGPETEIGRMNRLVWNAGERYMQ
jgi:hypothetical protein